ncbi:MAG TPA: site-2 protease family protein [Pyrinomonadaceae bacterium]|jgi:membrane-associated protease RseP (regulator of RpoE activity)|nr:site-2 protease family protein [Pyrinomonadaceae bacterium]
MSETLRPAAGFEPFAAPPVVIARGRAARPTAREWWRHAGLFLLTALACTFAGVMQAIPNDAAIEPALAAPARLFDYVSYVPAYYALTVAAVIKYAAAHPALVAQGVTFAAALLSILAAHESGHYVACRRYGVEATLPFFIPAPPLFLAGTFGAFIKIKSPIPTRRALFDIGVAGPLAGFLVIIPVAIAAILTTHPAPPLPAPGADADAAGALVFFNDPPLLRLLARALRMDIANAAPNPFYFAAWIGLLVTSLNLLPVGQLDGGHAVFSVFGERAHRLVGRFAFAAMLALAVLGWLWHHAPGGFVYAVLLFVMLRLPHPRATTEEATLGRARIVVAWLTLAVFLLCFEPFPLSIS